jgi:hypothetical protein
MSNNLNLPSDILLIIECCKEKPCIKKIDIYLKKIQDINNFVYKARCHGILPLVYRTLREIESNNLAKSLIKILQDNYKQIAKDNMMLSLELINLSKLLEDNNIEYLSFKGPTLSIVAYGDITFRQYCDIDILVSLSDIDKISKILINNDYRKDLLLSDFEESFRKDNSHELSFINNKNNVLVEFHWNLVDNDHPIKFNLLSYFKESQKVIINKKKINVFKNEYLLVYLCGHGCNHLYERIEWIVDIDKLIINNELNWKLIDDIIFDSSEVRDSVLFSLNYTFKLFNTPIPDRYLNTKNDKFFIKLGERLHKKENIFGNIFFKLNFISNFKNKIKFLHKMLFKPTLNELRYIKLNENIYFMYYFIRFYLMIIKLFNSNK